MDGYSLADFAAGLSAVTRAETSAASTFSSEQQELTSVSSSSEHHTGDERAFDFSEGIEVDK